MLEIKTYDFFEFLSLSEPSSCCFSFSQEDGRVFNLFKSAAGLDVDSEKD